MRAILINGTASVSTALLAMAFAAPANADDAESHRMGDHPAVVVQRLYRSAGYDYASKFYPHPAGLRLYGAPPDTLIDADAARPPRTVQKSIVPEGPVPMVAPLQAEAGAGG